LADLEYYERLKEIGKAELIARERKQEDDRREQQRIAHRLQSLSTEDYQPLYETVRRDFAAQYPSVMKFKASLFESAIRARMAQLLEEPAAIAPPVPPPPPPQDNNAPQSTL